MCDYNIKLYNYNINKVSLYKEKLDYMYIQYVF